jgi:TonB-linked SusC/RagA family outer membrane protein
MATQKVIRWISTAALLVASLASARVAYAQGAVIAGKVTTSQGRELEGANVTIPELNISVGTNGAGNYTISIPAARLTGGSAVLRVRSIGYIPQTRTVSLTAGSQSANFSLVQDVNRLQAVVTTGVTGATETTKLPFAVAHLDSNDFKVAQTNPLLQIRGKVPGAAIVSASGRPGASPAVLLRGPTAITGQGRGQTPLYIVDGVIISDQGSQTAGGGLPDINPLDIESVEVVKGAAASSLYGARAGNGVITIRTKSGLNSAEGVHFTARTEYGTSDVEHHFDIAQRTALELDETGQRYCFLTGTNAPYTGTYQCARSLDYGKELFRINDQATGVQILSPIGTFPVDLNSSRSRDEPILTSSFLIRHYPGLNYDAVSQEVRPKPLLQNTLDMRGRYGKTAFFASASNLNQRGAIIYLNGFQRQTGRLNLDQQIGTRWSASLTSYYARSHQDGYYQEDNGGGAFFNLTRQPPVANLEATDSHGRLYLRTNLQSSGAQNSNPLYQLQNRHEFTKGNHFIGGGTLRYAAASWLDFEGNLSYDGSQTNLDNFLDKGYRLITSAADASALEKGSEQLQAYNTGINMNIRHDLLSDMHSRTSIRYGYGREDYDYRDASGGQLAVIGVPALSNATQSTLSVASTTRSIRSIGFIAAENLEWKDRYIIDGLVRRDASSLFGAGNRWATFGRGSVAWRMSQEPFWFIPAINELKVRASIGTAGGRPPFAAQYQTFSVSSGTISPGVLGNNLLKPESIRENEYGVDMEAFHRIGISFDYSRSDSRDQILLVPPPAASGFSSQWQNAGVLQNKTFEGSISVPIINGRDVQYSTRFIYDHNRAVITHLYVPQFNFGANVQGGTTIFLACGSTPGETGSCNATAQQRAGGQDARYGTFYGRQFVRNCSQLPSAAQSSCGPGLDFQRNNEGFIVWVGKGNTINDGITKNLWQARLPSTSPFYAQSGNKDGFFSQAVVPVSWGALIVMRDSTGNALQIPLGNPLPKFRWGFSQTLNVKRLSAYALIDAAIGQRVYNEGRGWSYLDFLEGREDQTGRSVSDAKPVGYYYRAGAPDNSGIGGYYDILGPNSNMVESASYAKLREVNVGLHIGRVGNVGGDWSLNVIGRNLHTWTNYLGFDPEVGFGSVSGSNSTSQGSGSGAINATDSFTFPNLRSFSFSLSSSF